MKGAKKAKRISSAKFRCQSSNGTNQVKEPYRAGSYCHALALHVSRNLSKIHYNALYNKPLRYEKVHKDSIVGSSMAVSRATVIGACATTAATQS